MATAYNGMKVNVVGLGATGLSLVRHLHAEGASVRAFDADAAAAGRERLAQEFPSVPFTPVDLQSQALPKADLIALSPGVPRASFAIQAALKAGTFVVGDIELFARKTAGKSLIFAITGSNGKTTTAHIAHGLARLADPDSILAGNVGLPVLDAIGQAPKARTWVLELSSFQLESTESLAPESAAVLNITQNHLDRYPSFFAYASSKERIFQRSKRQVLNRNDSWSLAMRRTDQPCTSFGTDAPERDEDMGIQAQMIVQGSTPIIELDRMRIRGAHNAQNAMAALALTQSLGAAAAQSRAVLESFSGVPHRYQWLGNLRGIEVIDDSKATTVIAAIAAIQANPAPAWLIAGGDGKSQSFAEFARAASACRAVHLIGRDAPAMSEALSVCGVPHQIFASLEDATIAALDQAKDGERLLLAPACASWDMFRNFEHRADVFAAAVKSWATAKGLTLSLERGYA